MTRRLVKAFLSAMALLHADSENSRFGVSGFVHPTSFGRQPPLLHLRADSSISIAKSQQQVPIQYRSTGSTERHALVPGSSLQVIEPETGCEVVLVGCFHGSKSSAMDVSTCMTPPSAENNNDDNNKNNSATTQVVVLELCASRFADMRRDMQRQAQDEPGGLATRQRQKPWIVRFGAMISKTIQSRGLSTGLAAALLGGVSGMQTSLSGSEPGLEFRTAVEWVQTHGNNGNDDDEAAPPCDIILADQNVEETLDKVGQLVSISAEMWRTCWQQGWDALFGRESDALARAVGLVGSSHDDDNDTATTTTTAPLNLFNFCTRSPEAIRDMARLLVPPAVVLQGIVLTLDQAMTRLALSADGGGEVADAILYALNTDVATTGMSTADTLSVMMLNLAILAMGYLSVALPAVKVILRERDDCLTDGIREACRVATEKAGEGKKGRVVAVLGLLHVNGIAQRLRATTNGDSGIDTRE